jgi:hypothetical protein
VNLSQARKGILRFDEERFERRWNDSYLLRKFRSQIPLLAITQIAIVTLITKGRRKTLKKKFSEGK